MIDLFKFLGMILPTILLLFFVATIFFGFVFGMPIMQKEKTKNFLDVLDIAMKEGHSPEQTIVGLSKMREESFGLRFHILAAHIEDGFRLAQALEKTPKFLPQKIKAMLRIGEETSLLRPMLIACRKSLADAKSQTLSGFDYLSPSFLATAVLPVIFSVLAIVIFPKFMFILNDFQIPIPRLTSLVFNAGWIIAIPLLITSAIFCFRLLFSENSTIRPTSLGDKLHFKTSWRHARMQRDFATTLALLLDAEVPEEKALIFAAEATDNQVFIRQVDSVITRLHHGLKLTEAIAYLDATGEFQWRLKNAVHGQGGFFAALSGWMETLDAKAFQQEQTASHFFTSGLILLNAVAVGLVSIGMFQVLIAIINAGVLW